MKIRICDWTGGRLEEALSARYNADLQCTQEDALKLAATLYSAGLDVMLEHRTGGDVNAVLWVDDQGFTQRCLSHHRRATVV